MISAEKWGAVLALHKAGHGPVYISKQEKISRTSIAKILRQRKRPKERKGRVLKRVEKRRRVLKRLAPQTKVVNGKVLPKNPSLECLKAALKREGIKASKSTIHTDMSETHDVVVRPLRPFDGQNSMSLREELKERYRNAPSVMKRIVFSDEHFITTNDHTTRTMWVLKKSANGARKEQPVPRIRKSRYNVPSVMIWAAIGVDFRSTLVFIPKKKDGDGKTLGMDSKRYVRTCLAKVVNRLPVGSIFMQDGARCHTAKNTIRYLEGKGVHLLPHWPPYSPDLNPIENLWHYLDRRIAEHAPNSLEALKRVATQVWEQIPQEVINNFVLSFASKLENNIE